MSASAQEMPTHASATYRAYLESTAPKFETTFDAVADQIAASLKTENEDFYCTIPAPVDIVMVNAVDAYVKKLGLYTRAGKNILRHAINQYGITDPTLPVEMQVVAPHGIIMSKETMAVMLQDPTYSADVADFLVRRQQHEMAEAEQSAEAKRLVINKYVTTIKAAFDIGAEETVPLVISEEDNFAREDICNELNNLGYATSRTCDDPVLKVVISYEAKKKFVSDFAATKKLERYYKKARVSEPEVAEVEVTVEAVEAK